MPPCSSHAVLPRTNLTPRAADLEMRRKRGGQFAPEVLVVLDPVLEIGVREVELLLVAHCGAASAAPGSVRGGCPNSQLNTVSADFVDAVRL
jgi:hypothetical protein